MDKITARKLLESIEEYGQFGLTTKASDRLAIYLTAIDQAHDYGRQIIEEVDNILESVDTNDQYSFLQLEDLIEEFKYLGGLLARARAAG